MSEKHTPGEGWVFVRVGCGVYEDTSRLKIASVGLGGADEAELLRRGHLIAAAPDLLKALQAYAEAKEHALAESAVTSDGERVSMAAMDKSDQLFRRAARLMEAALAKAQPFLGKE